MSGSIQLHPKFGVNPTLGVCFWCGQGDGTVGLLGWNKGKEANKESVLTLVPCATCKENMAKGITIIEATTYQRDKWQVQLQDGAYPTGRWCVVKRDAQFWNVIKEPMRTVAMQKGKVFFEPELYEGFGFVAAAKETT